MLAKCAVLEEKQARLGFRLLKTFFTMSVRSLTTCFFISLFAWAAANNGGGERLTAAQYIDQWKDVAVQQMQMHGIPASITLAQGLLESGNGNSDLARKSNNHFGIKCHSDWKGKRVYHDDDRKGECFRKYKDAADSYRDHSIFLKKRRYEFLFDLRPTDYKGWARGLKKAGYATDPKYPAKLIKLIETHRLHEFDKQSGGGMFASKKKRPSQTSQQVDEPETVSIGTGLSMMVHENNVRYVMARKGDDFRALAKEMGLRPAMLARWNDMDKKKRLEEGTVIFIQPKRNKFKGKEIHHVRAGDSLWSISQAYGVKLSKICEYNGLRANVSITPGQKVRLQKKGGSTVFGGLLAR